MQETIELLIQLQNTDLSSDAIQNKKGSLPKEISRLEGELKDLQNKKEQCEEEAAYQKNLIDEYKKTSKLATEIIVQYKQDYLTAINNKEEYDNITQEIALQELEIKLAKKKIKIAQENINRQNEQLEEIKALIKDNKDTTEFKKENLAKIAKATKAEEAKLEKQRKKITDQIQDARLLQKYQTLRKRFSFVVASVVQEACNGCFLVVPIQKQIKIREKKKIFMCENCDRMLAKAEQAETEEQNVQKSQMS